MKRIISLLLTLAVLLSAVCTGISAAEDVVISVSTNKNTVKIGDTIDFQIAIGKISRLGGLEFTLKIPDGLELIAESVSIPSGLETTLDSDGSIVLPTAGNGYKWSYTAQKNGYTGTTDLVLLTFSCLAKTAGKKEVSINLVDIFDNDVMETFPTTIKGASLVVGISAIKIELNKRETTINIGSTETLVATIEPTNTTDSVTWTSSNIAVATVDQMGKVTGVSEGNTIITAKANDAASATCSVTVTKAVCKHENKTLHAAQESTCKEKGWDPYYTCECGKMFDSAGMEIAEVPFRPLADHFGGKATCKELAVCDGCGQPYGSFASHVYTAKTQNTETLKSAGTCKAEAVYFYSCSGCGVVERTAAHTFTGSKDANNHAGGTKLVGKADADHKNQKDGYTGDTVCNGCEKTLEKGSVISAGAHVWAKIWSSDKSGHWHTCTVADCGAKDTVLPHNPDHTGGATEEYAVLCKDCGFVIEAQLSHKHSYTAKTQNSETLMTAGTCKAEAVYFYSCSGCGVVERNAAHTFAGSKDANNHAGGTKLVGKADADHKNQKDGYTGDTVCNGCEKTLEKGSVISAGAHVWAKTWSNDKGGHWHTCTVAGCGAKDTVLAHTPDHLGGATEEYAVLCKDCGFVIEAQLGHTHATEKVEGYAASCEAAGRKTYYTCVCGKWFEDAAATGEITDKNSVTIPAAGHDMEAEWTTENGSHSRGCKNCDFVEGPIACSGGKATCKELAACAACGHAYGELNPENHGKTEVRDAVLPTVETEGYTGDTYCLDCGELVEKGKIVPTLDPENPEYHFPNEGFSISLTQMSFVDVQATDYYYDAVLWAVRMGITGGVSATRFAPEKACTRAEMVTFLWRAKGSPAPKSTAMPFSDVEKGAWYYDAVLWAYENGITSGVSETQFAPNETVTRAQTVTLLWRANGAPKEVGNTTFRDVDKQDYYYNAVLWAVRNNITNGTSQNTFAPDASCLRAQIVTFLWRYLTK